MQVHLAPDSTRALALEIGPKSGSVRTMSRTVAPRRNRVRRVPARAVYDRAAIHTILDEALIAHLGFVHDGHPFVIPTLHARVGETVYVHGSAASRAVRTMSAGAPACLTVTLFDGVVLARSAFHHSANYRSVVVLGNASPVEGADERLRALEAFSERLVPGRWAEVRPPTPKELKGTRVLAMSLDECSAKVRSGPPEDDPQDIDLRESIWAGVIPVHTIAGAPQADAFTPPEVAPSAAVTGWTPQRR
jgi:nitroimidazol reductase NimA-like FMN-containing flavoprotein (pyridoxamine 5'-phosphate oxidase superfamily)